MMFDQVLQQHFPGALPGVEFVARSYMALRALGFSRTNAITCVGVCRDELTQPLVAEIRKMWGDPFDFSGLAGMLFLGKTGFGAAHHHSPKIGGWERYVYFAMPHIAINGEGLVGVCERRGRLEPSGACGALLAYQKELTKGEVGQEPDPLDVEQGLLKQRLGARLPVGPVPDLLTLTRLAYEVILADLEQMISLTVNTASSDYAVLTGIQVHGPGGKEHVWPGTLYAVIAGRKQDLTL